MKYDGVRGRAEDNSAHTERRKRESTRTMGGQRVEKGTAVVTRCGVCVPPYDQMARGNIYVHLRS